MKEHKRTQRISGMLLKGDSLDYAMLSALKQIPQEPPKVEVAEYLKEEGVKGIILSLPALEAVSSISQMSLFFVNAFANPARQFFLTHVLQVCPSKN